MDDNSRKILSEIILKMNYDTSKTLNENIMEQEPSLERMVDWRGMGTKRYTDYKKLQQEKAAEALTTIGQTLSDPHVFLPLLALVATFATGGVAGAVLALAFEAADVALYIKEGDNKSAGIAIAFAAIPGAQLAKRLGLPFIENISKSQVSTLLKKVDDGIKLTKTESDIVEGIAKNSDWIAKNAVIYTSKELIKRMFSKYTGMKLVVFMMKLARLGLVSWKTTYNLSKYGLGFLTLWQIGSILGDYLGGQQPSMVDYPDGFKRLSDDKKEIYRENLKSSIENDKTIFEPSLKQAEKVLETNSETKNKQVAEALSKMDDELDAMLD